MPDPRFRHVAEDVGLGRIFRGYQNIECDEWVCFLKLLVPNAKYIYIYIFTQSQILERHIQPLPSSATMIQNVNRVDAVQGLDDRLWERQCVS